MKLKVLVSYLFLAALISFSGCENNSEEHLYGEDCDTEDMTYSKVKYIFENNCYTCHTIPQGNYGIKLDTYSDVKNAVNTGRLWPAINHTGPINMPLNQHKLSDCQIAKVGAWINEGMPE